MQTNEKTKYKALQKILLILILILFGLSCINILIYIDETKPTEKTWWPPGIGLYQTISEDGWELTLSSVGPPYGYPCSMFEYRLINDTGYPSEHGSLETIKNKNSLGYNITFLDTDNNDLVNIGDALFINKFGGFYGKAQSGNMVWLIFDNATICAEIILK